MEKIRLMGLDSFKGFGIFMMVMIHGLIQLVAQRKYEIFIPLVQNAPTYAIILLAPIAMLSLMGSAFLYANCTSITIQMLHTAKQKPELLGKSVRMRILSNVLVLLVSEIFWYYLETPYTGYDLYVNEKVPFRFGAESVDSIVLSAMIVSIILYLILIFPKNRNPKKIFISFFICTIIWYVISEPFTIWGQKTLPILQENKLYVIQYFLAKFVVSRFKLSQTLGVGFLGICLGCLLTMKISKSTLLWFLLVINSITIPTFVIFILIDSSFLSNYVSEELPFPLLILMIGLESILIFYFVIQCDYRDPNSRIRNRKRMTWLRRFSLISLTAYIFDTDIDGVVYQLNKIIFGPSIVYSGTVPLLAWSAIQIIFFELTLFAFWEILLLLWEKIDFALSLEWLLLIILNRTKIKEIRTRNREILYVSLEEPVQSIPTLPD
jgi:hypothetical protein